MRLIFVVILTAAFQRGLAQQSQPEEPMATHQDLLKSVHIFPNPATGEWVHVKVEQFPAAKVKLALHNIIGNQVDIETEVVDEHELRVKVKDLASGYYLLAVKEDDSNFRGTYKFLKR